MYINTEYFSPVINNGITKAHPLSYEYREWWDEQKRRCLENVGKITPGTNPTRAPRDPTKLNGTT